MGHTLWVLGDSTVSAFNDNYYMPRYGYGTALPMFFNDELEVKNLAISGTSSKSFTTRDNYRLFLEGMKPGDFMMLGFGHNDEKHGDVTFTSGSGDKDTEGSFANRLYTSYIKPALENDVTPILITPTVRWVEDGVYKGSDIHITADGDYPEAERELAKACKVTLVDLTALTLELNKKMGYDGLYLHSRTASRLLCVDNTHTNYCGALVHAFLIVKTLQKSDCGIKKYIKSELYDPFEHDKELIDKSIICVKGYGYSL